jgi:hypothetical protein
MGEEKSITCTRCLDTGWRPTVGHESLHNFWQENFDVLEPCSCIMGQSVVNSFEEPILFDEFDEVLFGGRSDEGIAWG